MSSHPPATRHGPIQSITSRVSWVQGCVRMKPGVVINRNMAIVRDGTELTLVNAVRLNDEGLKALDALGKVTRVVKLGAFHGMDDAFYCERYGADYAVVDNDFDESRPLAVDGVTTFCFNGSKRPEGALLVTSDDGNTLLTTDSLQYHPDFKGCSLLARFIMPRLGFRTGLQVGPPWLRIMNPDSGSLRSEFERLAQLDAQYLLGAHGRVLKDDVRGQLQQATARAFD